MFIKGINHTNQNNLDPPSNSLIFQNSDEEVVAYIDELGNLYLKGEIFENQKIE